MQPKYRTAEVPERIKKLPQYKGIYIPYTTLIDEKGIPHFSATDPDRPWEVKRDGKCSICGEPLDYWISFMVTEDEAESRIVYENPNHEECLKYAFNVCPWLYYSKATYSEIDKVKVDGVIMVGAHPDREIANTRPPKLGVYITNHYKNVIVDRYYRVCKVGKAKRLEWIDGK